MCTPETKAHSSRVLWLILQGCIIQFELGKGVPELFIVIGFLQSNAILPVSKCLFPSEFVHQQIIRALNG
jgi:hypothetical protein